ncbi:isoprenyl transferase [Nordella sp. HKS 07]|uniref:isoprenyl transferase n=1 Tax=Nordella sp. HKS 07 TaxID=2712222 RepID=UPI0013E20611|nr:isoprenyl transferase [Nordella sp. HKS 07]QIG51213.1 isoprenyl transferase [Nordella sp. HKS 07]
MTSHGGRAAVPRHVAIIMDGNGRWAHARGLPRSAGHRKGVEALRTAVQAAGEMGVSYLTIFSFSSENWSRPPSEVSFLLDLMRHFVRQDVAELDRANVRIRIIGERRGLAADIVALIEETEERTRANTGLTLVVAFNYGSRQEITAAARGLAFAVREGRVAPESITPELFGSFLETDGIPDPDLLIRTSGEQRLSNYLLWQCAYTELVFVDEYWPDFSRETLERAIAEYQTRERRFGGLQAQSA